MDKFLLVKVIQKWYPFWGIVPISLILKFKINNILTELLKCKGEKQNKF